MNTPTILTKTWIQKVFLILSLASTMFAGFHIGNVAATRPLPPSASALQYTQHDLHQPGDFLHILGVLDNSVIIQGGTRPLRLRQGDAYYEVTPGSTVALFVDNTELPPPPTATLGAPCILMGSPTGKYVYLKNSSQAERLSNPVCFESVADAMNAGYLLKE